MPLLRTASESVDAAAACALWCAALRCQSHITAFISHRSIPCNRCAVRRSINRLPHVSPGSPWPRLTSAQLQRIAHVTSVTNSLHVLAACISTGGPAKLAQICVIRKSIARTLTVYNQNERDALRKAYRKRHYKPLDLRLKQTRAIRHRLTKVQSSRLTARAAKKAAYFPQRKFALKA